MRGSRKHIRTASPATQNPPIRISAIQAVDLKLWPHRLLSKGIRKTFKVKVRRRVRAFSFLKKVRGKKRRVRVHVAGYTRELTYVFSVLVRPPRAKPKPKPKPKRVSIPRWENVQSYMRRLRKSYDLDRMDLVYRTNVNTDVVSSVDSFVWDKPLTASSEAGRRRPLWRAARVWFLLYRSNSDDYVVGSRSAVFPHATNSFNEASAEVEKIRQGVTDYYENFETDSEGDSYFALEGFLAWTMYQGFEAMGSV